MTRRWTGLAAALSVVVAGACSDVAGPQEAIEAPQFITIPSEVPGLVSLCVDGPGTHSFSFSHTAGTSGSWTGTLGTLTEGASTTVAGGTCKTIWTKSVPYPGAPGPADVRVNLGIVHNGLAAGTVFTGVNVIAASTPTVVSGMNVALQPNVYHGAVVVYQFDHQLQAGEGCTPGYWRNTRRAWPISNATDFDTYFGVNTFNPDRTLGAAVALNGGGWNALARHATAALLNALEPGVEYPMTAAQVIALVQQAAAGGVGVDDAKNTLEAHNELGCPIPNR
jgi:hypothetical protein